MAGKRKKNRIHPHSKAAMCAHARILIRALILILQEARMSYEDIEAELRLHWRNGMTVHEYVNLKTKKAKREAAEFHQRLIEQAKAKEAGEKASIA